MVQFQELLRSLHEEDWSVVDLSDVPTECIAALGENLAGLERRAREIAVIFLGRQPHPEAKSLLLKMTRDRNGQIAADAAGAIAENRPLPATKEIEEALVDQGDPLIREFLYRALGRVGGAEALGVLRRRAIDELDPRAAAWLQVAEVKAGGGAEREKFRERFPRAEAGEAEELCEQLSYVGDLRLSHVLRPWLDREDPVPVSEAGLPGPEIRLCDLALWTLATLGVLLAPAPAYLGRFDETVRRSVVQGLERIGGGAEEEPAQ